MPDPHEPGWRPEYTGDDSLGDVGTGFGAELYELYRAGRVLYPQTAWRYYEFTRTLHTTEPVMRQVLAEGRTPQAAHTLLLDLRDVLQEVLGKSSVHIAETGDTLVDIADSYAATDEATAAEFAQAMDADDDYRHYYDDRSRLRVPPPPAPGDPQPLPPPYLRPDPPAAGR